MKLQKQIITALFILLGLGLNAQVPPQINYQAVVRNAAGVAEANTNVQLQFIIHDGSATGTVVYTETTSTITTNQFGLVTAAIGSNADLNVIQWGVNSKWLEVKADIGVTGTFTSMGTTQLNAVPYSLYAANAPTGLQGATGATGATDVGLPGNTGATGLNGVNGATGPQGPAGNNGTNGITGATGPAGVGGATGATGSGGGATGATGATGANGNTGATGPTGNSGAIGSTGATGPTGSNGSTGATGTGGGATGPAGATDAIGATGMVGPPGAAGANGVTGATGPTGNNGINGVTGATGVGGGATGPAGATGITGPTGNNGTQGTTGATGLNGATGASGAAGNTGATGPSGSNNAWSLTGNAGTSPLTNFIGTTDNNDFAVKTNNQERMRVDALGHIGIGLAAPIHQLDVITSYAGINAISGVNNSVLSGGDWSGGDNYAGISGQGAGGTTQFQAGVYGYMIGTGHNSGGVIGAYSSAIWAGLGYVDGIGKLWGLYSNYNSCFMDTVKIADGSQGLNKVFTSDANGVGSWKYLSALGDTGTVQGTLNYIPVFTSGSSVGNSVMYQQGGYKIGIGTIYPHANF